MKINKKYIYNKTGISLSNIFYTICTFDIKNSDQSIRLTLKHVTVQVTLTNNECIFMLYKI